MARFVVLFCICIYVCFLSCFVGSAKNVLSAQSQNEQNGNKLFSFFVSSLTIYLAKNAWFPLVRCIIVILYFNCQINPNKLIYKKHRPIPWCSDGDRKSSLLPHFTVNISVSLITSFNKYAIHCLYSSF